jgi:hypothetical protein
MRKHLSLKTAVAVAGLFAANMASATSYLDLSLYGTTSGAVSVFSTQAIVNASTTNPSNLIPESTLTETLGGTGVGITSFQYSFTGLSQAGLTETAWYSLNGGAHQTLATNAATNVTVNLGSTFTGTITFGNTVAGVGGSALIVDNVAIAAAVPEPEEWALMLAGLPLVGWKLRNRKAANVAQAAA